MSVVLEEGLKFDQLRYCKAPAHAVMTGQARRGLPGKVISFYIVPLDPAYKAGFGGHVPVKFRLG